jgi:hypothetical protein
MSLSPMSALERITDSSRTSRQVGKVPLNEPALAGGCGGEVGRIASGAVII